MIILERDYSPESRNDIPQSFMYSSFCFKLIVYGTLLVFRLPDNP